MKIRRLRFVAPITVTKVSGAPYSLRARNNLPASAPLSWEDLEKVDAPEDFNYSSLPGLVAASGDPWADIDSFARDLPAPLRVKG